MKIEFGHPPPPSITTQYCAGALTNSVSVYEVQDVAFKAVILSPVFYPA